MHGITTLFIALVTSIGLLFGLLHSSTAQEASVSTSSATLTGIGVKIANIFSSTTSTSSLPAGSAWLTTLPLGDNKYVTTAPKKGYVYVCNVQSGGQGAQANGPWIHGLTWNPGEKVHVQGSVSWPQATYSMKVTNGTRLISSNDLPTDHTTGVFPVAATDPAAAYDRNQGSITAHAYSFSFSSYPEVVTKPGCIYGEVGIMNNGVLLFDGFDALYRDALAHEVQDSHDGHPNNEGYHKHGFISDIKKVVVSQVVGFAFDGYPITGPLLPSGKYLTTNDLDECHGMTSTITLDGKNKTSYHYVLTQDFPYSVSCFHGTSKVTPNTLKAQGLETNSIENTQVQGSVSGKAETATTPPAPPGQAISVCTGKAPGARCTVGTSVTGTCSTIGTAFACKPG